MRGRKKKEHKGRWHRAAFLLRFATDQLARRSAAPTPLSRPLRRSLRSVFVSVSPSTLARLRPLLRSWRSCALQRPSGRSRVLLTTPLRRFAMSSHRQRTGQRDGRVSGDRRHLPASSVASDFPNLNRNDLLAHFSENSVNGAGCPAKRTPVLKLTSRQPSARPMRTCMYLHPCRYASMVGKVLVNGHISSFKVTAARQEGFCI